MMQLNREMMQLCLSLAQKAQGKTSPNPLVGAVVVQDRVVVGKGFYPQAGQPNAEVFALKNAGEKAQGATVYINLEPPLHCCPDLIEAQVKKVVLGGVKTRYAQNLSRCKVV
jgi:diaminohydroxyphosphoribosylaminopyrimidine deaminase/5-amino-6-(5-phosphoribosylamino)uracil reductase